MGRASRGPGCPEQAWAWPLLSSALGWVGIARGRGYHGPNNDIVSQDWHMKPGLMRLSEAGPTQHRQRGGAAQLESRKASGLHRGRAPPNPTAPCCSRDRPRQRECGQCVYARSADRLENRGQHKWALCRHSLRGQDTVSQRRGSHRIPRLLSEPSPPCAELPS